MPVHDGEQSNVPEHVPVQQFMLIDAVFICFGDVLYHVLACWHHIGMNGLLFWVGLY